MCPRFSDTDRECSQKAVCMFVLAHLVNLVLCEYLGSNEREA